MSNPNQMQIGCKPALKFSIVVFAREDGAEIVPADSVQTFAEVTAAEFDG